MFYNAYVCFSLKMGVHSVHQTIDAARNWINEYPYKSVCVMVEWQRVDKTELGQLLETDLTHTDLNSEGWTPYIP